MRRALAALGIAFGPNHGLRTKTEVRPALLLALFRPPDPLSTIRPPPSVWLSLPSSRCDPSIALSLSLSLSLSPDVCRSPILQLASLCPNIPQHVAGRIVAAPESLHRVGASYEVARHGGLRPFLPRLDTVS
jgi:hypothetical protein